MNPIKKKSSDILFLRATSICLLYFFLPLKAFCQNENKNWYFGTGTDGLIFINNIPQKVSNKYNWVGYEGMIVVSNPVTGELQFYSDGEKVIDKDHNIMSNGTGLSGAASGSQCVQCCPIPGSSDRKFYLFTNSAWDFTSGVISYSIVDFTSNPLGIVTNNNTPLWNGPSDQGMCLVNKSNSNDYWLISNVYATATYYVWAITSSGIGIPSIYTFTNTGESYQMNYDHTTQKLIVTGYGNKHITLINFNAVTGVLTNEIQLGSAFGDCLSARFSPDGSKLYAGVTPVGSPSPTLYQYDFASSVWTNMNTCCYAHDIKKGPDGKMYHIHTYNDSQPIAVIEFPNLSAINNSCNYHTITFNPGFDGEVRRFPEFVTLPNTIIINTSDTTICAGNSITLSVNVAQSVNDTILPPGSQFEYTFNEPAAGWTTTTGGWASGNAPFGNLSNGSPPEFNYNTYWPSNIPEGVDGLDLHIRKNINFSGFDLSAIHWYLGVDNGFILYVNGTPIDSSYEDGYAYRWEYSGIIPAALSTTGNNIIAIGLIDDGESTAFDMMILGQRLSQGTSILWSTGDTTASITVTPIQNTTYFVTVTTGTNICSDSIRISVGVPSVQLINASVCQGENYAGYTASGIYIDTLVAANGCDSVRTINLTVNPRTFSNITQSICAGQSFEGYTSTGTYIDTLVAANGCDSVRTINLTVNQRTFSNITQSICAGQSFEGYASAGNYIDTLVAANGCDSIRTINLTVNQRMFSNITQSICAGQSFEGYSSAGIYIDTLVAANSCDSIRTINLTVNQRMFSNITQSICAGQSFEGYTSAGTYIDVLVAANGCDSVRTINLTVKSRSYLTIIQSICQGQTYLGHNTGGTYIDTLVAINGCDSIRTLQLTILSKPIPDLGSDKEICSGDSLILYPGSFSTYNWQNGLTQSHFVANQPGMYSVLVTNNCGSAIDQILIKEKICDIYFPSAFTPNNDGKNDLFKVLGAHAISDYHLTVYNRWGQKIFETTDYTKGWDGLVNGKLQNTGVFVWHSEFKNAGNPNKILMKGTVLLIK